MQEQIDEVVAVHGTLASPVSAEKVEVRTVCFRARQALEAFAHLQQHTPERSDPEHAEMRSDLQAVERLLARWDPGPG